MIEQDEDGFFVASVPALRSCYTQAKTLEELSPRIREVVSLCLEEEEPVPLKFIGEFFRHPDGRTATVPFHKGEDIGRGLTEKILKDADVTRDVSNGSKNDSHPAPTWEPIRNRNVCP